VCGETCELYTDSDILYASCILPPLVTEHSISAYKLARDEELAVQWVDEEQNSVTALTDGELTINLEAGTGDGPCVISG
jgi:hypothetical protein